MQKNNKKTFRSPPGIARWPYIKTPDFKYDKEGKYAVSLEVDPREKGGYRLLHGLRVMAQRKYGPKAHVPYREDVDRDGRPTGKYLVKFSSKFMPRIYDRHGNILTDADIPAGAVLVVQFTPNLYGPNRLVPSGGLNLRLCAIHVRTKAA